MKPYQKVPIQDCGEALMPIPLEQFSVVSPHPYQSLGAPYGDRTPYFLRQGVLTQLIQAQKFLQTKAPGWQLEIFDAYRPIPVQQFMVDHTLAQLAEAEGLKINELTAAERSRLHTQVITFWAVPSPNPATPPPHSTGAAIDLTLCDAQGTPVDMGSPIDEISPRSYPNHFASDPSPHAKSAHRHRSLLTEVMVGAGFRQHPNEWWHFSLGDQLWALQKGEGAIARYGSA
ncbi:MAG: M15 family metallopeptidase [Cyanobacteria bacterium J06598_1]